MDRSRGQQTRRLPDLRRREDALADVLNMRRDRPNMSVYKCADCGAEVKSDDPPTWCPSCGSVNIGYDREDEPGE